MTYKISYTREDKIDVTENRIYVEFATVDDTRVPVKHFSLIFDTGAFITLISKERAVRNGYRVIENFTFGLDLTEKEIYLNIRSGFVSQKPKYRCRDVSLFQETARGSVI